MGGGGGVTVPGPSPEERALQAEQASLLREQRDMLSRQIRETNLLAPMLFEQAGLRAVRDANGEITSLERMPLEEMSPETRQAAEIQDLFSKRSLAALKGELPVDPGLLRRLNEEETTLGEALRKEMGTGWRTSSPGIQATEEFARRKSDILESARRGDLTLAEQLGQAREASILARPFSEIGATLAPSQRFANPFANASATGAGYSSALSQYAQDRNMQLQAAIANSQARSSSAAGFGKFAGAALGSVFGGPVKPWIFG